MKEEYDVIILEDDLVLAELMKKQVNKIQGFRCTRVFINPVQFLQSDVDADIVLLDVLMPEMNGLDAIEPIIKKHQNVAIIMNTIKDDSDTIFAALERGALGYIDKQSFDIKYEEVLRIVAQGGAYMTPKIARKIFNSFQRPRLNFETLTDRERDVTNGILAGLSYKMIAARYDISVDTVRMNIKNIYRKLKINSKGQLFRLAKHN